MSKNGCEGDWSDIVALIGGLVHEVRNPLSTIKLNIQLLREQLEARNDPDTEKLMRRLGVIETETGRLAEILNDILGFVKIEGSQWESFSVNRMVDDVLEFFQPTAEEHNVQVLKYLDPAVSEIKGDAKLLRQAVLNLLINAKDAMPDGGQLIVRTSLRGREICIEVTDTGAGMSEEVKARIFKPFFTTKQGGTGLGLATVKRIVGRHNGRIVVHSEPGKGSSFQILLSAENESGG